MAKYISRKKFLLWTAAVISATGLIKIWNPLAKKKVITSKYLTEDGKLVEVDEHHLSERGVKIYTSDLKTWIKKDPSTLAQTK
jgi:hypothetical protein